MKLTGYPTADDLFQRGEYATAFRAYYQTFFCENYYPLHMGINPVAEDSGAKPYLREGLRFAIGGQYARAATAFKAGIRLDPLFSEGQYLLGDVLWLSHKRSAAVHWWKMAARNFGYPQPPDAVTTPLPAYAARKMLKAPPHAGK